MKNLPAITLLATLLSACGGSDDEQVTEEGMYSCLGFGASDINITVRDSLSDDIIQSALVQIHIEDDAETIIEASYIDGEDDISNTDENAYYALFDVNVSEFEYGIVVSESNYHSFVTRNQSYTLETSCGADNTVTTTVYLCRLGSECL